MAFCIICSRRESKGSQVATPIALLINCKLCACRRHVCTCDLMYTLLLQAPCVPCLGLASAYTLAVASIYCSSCKCGVEATGVLSFATPFYNYSCEVWSIEVKMLSTSFAELFIIGL